MNNDIQKIRNFISNNKEKLGELNESINKFNPFKVLKLQDYEIRHSNMIAWLFNPKENHNLGNQVLNKFWETIISKSENDDVLEELKKRHKIDQITLNNIKVYREYDNIDIVLVDEISKVVMFIENKIYSDERKNQLSRYLEKIEKNYPKQEYIQMPIYLTINDETKKDGYFLIKHKDLIQIIEPVIEESRTMILPEIITFIEYYVNILKEKYDLNEDLKRLCKEIYDENKDVIKMIYKVGTDRNIKKTTKKFKEDLKDKDPSIIINLEETDTWFYFAYEQFLKTKDFGDCKDEYGVICWFAAEQEKLRIAIGIQPFKDNSKRKDFLNHLIKEGVISREIKDQKNKINRIYSKHESIESWDEEDEVFGKMIDLYESDEFKNKLNEVIKAIDSFDWQ